MLSASDLLAIGGLVANAAGVLLLFRYGMPFRVSDPRGEFIITESLPAEEAHTDRLYRLLGYLGLVLIFAGTAAQVAAIVSA